MTDIEKAADVAASVLPGPIGEALARFLNDGVAIEDAQANPHLVNLADTLVYADGIREAVGLVHPVFDTRFQCGLALQFAVNGEAKTAEHAERLAEIALRYLFAVAEGVPAGHAPRGECNSTARLLAIAARMEDLSEEREWILQTFYCEEDGAA